MSASRALSSIIISGETEETGLPRTSVLARLAKFLEGFFSGSFIKFNSQLYTSPSLIVTPVTGIRLKLE